MSLSSEWIDYVVNDVVYYFETATSDSGISFKTVIVSTNKLTISFALD